MTPKGHSIEIILISALFVLLSVWGIIWDFTSGLLAGGIDGIMLLFVCLMMAGIFALMLLMQMQKAGFIPAFPAKKNKAAAAPPAAKPAAAAAPAAKPTAPAPQPTQSK